MAWLSSCGIYHIVVWTRFVSETNAISVYFKEWLSTEVELSYSTREYAVFS